MTLLVVSPFLIFSAQAAEPKLINILDYLGFTNVALRSVETFSAGKYNITLYAEFAGYHDQNELSYYQVSTSVFNVIFTGPEGGYEYIVPPIAKSFTTNFQFGLSMLCGETGHRYFTQESRNPDGLTHARVYENLDSPGMYLIGFENLYGQGADRDFNDMVFSLKPCPNQPPVASFTYSPLYPVIDETITFNATESYDPDGSIVSYQWDFGDENITTMNDPIITHIYTTANSTLNYTVTLTVTDNDGLTNSTTTTVPVTNPAILHVSIPAGEDRTGISDPDPWLSECWLLNFTGTSGMFTVKIEDVSWCAWSYDTHLVIALNDAAYNNLVSLTVNSITIVKNNFKNGMLRPYNLWNWPSGDVYPTWFNGTLVNVGNIPPKGHVNVTVSVTFSNATGARMHFDAYGSTKSSPIPPTKKSYITHNPLSEDSTVLFCPPPVVKYYLTVISPHGTPGGQGWYVNGTTAYATLDTGVVDHGNGTRRVFTHWSGDANGTSYASSDPIHIDQNKTATANWKTQYYLTLTTNPPNITTPSGEGWYDAGTYAPINTSEFVPGDPRYRFTGWTTSNMSEITDPSSTSTTVLMDEPKTVTANYVLQYNVTFTQTGLSSDATGTVVTVNGTAKTFGDLPFSMWVDSGDILVYSYANVSSTISGKRYRLDSVTGPTSPITVTADTIVTGNYVTQYQVTFAQTGLDATATGTVVTVNGDIKTYFDLPYTTWVDSGDSISYSYSDPVSSSVGDKRFKLVDVTGPTSPITVTDSVTVTGNYKIQYAVTFDQSGVGADFTGTVVTIDGSGYKVTDLPVSFWWDENSGHSFSFASPLIVNATTEYIWTSTSGLSSLQSDTLTITGSGSVTGHYTIKTQYEITFDQSGVGSDFTGTIVVIDGTNYGFADLPVSFWWDAGSSHDFAFQSPLVVTPDGKRYVWTSTSGLSSLQSESITVSASGTITGNYGTQYYLTVTSPYDSPTPSSGWFDDGDEITASVTSPWPGATGIRYVCTGWTGTGSVPASGSTASVTFTITQSSSITWTWKTQYYLTVSSAHGTTGGEGWYDASDTAYATVTPLTVPGPTGVRYVFTQWSEDASGNTSPSNPITMDGPKTAVANWKTQYTLTVKTDPLGLSPGPTPPTNWYDEGTNVQLTAQGVNGYTFDYWDVDGTPKGAGVNPITVPMGNPHTATAHYQTAAPPPPPPPSVGGYALPITLDLGTSSSLIPQIGLASALSAAVTATILLVRRGKKTSKRKH